jgi:uncharacterized integral membrane protein
MTTDPTGPGPARSADPDLEPPAAALPEGSTSTPPATAGRSTAGRGRPPGTGLTRVSAAWVAVGVSLLFLVLLIVFILQNGAHVNVTFLWFSGSLPLGVALLIAAVVGGIVVAVAGAARVVQLRHAARRAVRS